MRKSILSILLVAALVCWPAFGTLQSIGGYIYWPVPYPFSTSRNAALGTLALSASGDKVAAVFDVPASGTITQVAFCLNTVTTGDTLKIGLYTVDGANGNPTASAYGSSTTTTVVVADGDDNVCKVANIGDATATLGDKAAMVIEFNSYVAGNLLITTADSSNFAALIPYVDRFTGASWTKGIASPIMGLDYGGTYKPVVGAYTFNAVTDGAYGTGTTPDEAGNIFSVPFKCRVAGAWFYGDIDAGDDYQIILYDSDGSTALATFTGDSDNRQAATNGIQYVAFPATATLNINTNYRIIIKPTTANQLNMQYVDVDATIGAGLMAGMPGGTAIHYTSRSDAGSWSQTTTRRALIGVLIDQLDDGASSGGGSAARVVSY